MNARVLAEVAAELDLGAHLLLGKGEDAAGGRAKQSILADAFEAVVAAVYLDQGFAIARDLVLRCLSRSHRRRRRRARRPRLQDPSAGDHRGRASLGRPRYVVRDEGPDHAKHFFATVYVGDERVRRGRRSIEEASRAGRGMGRMDAPAGRVRRAGGRAMPELPEVEVLRRDLDKEVVGKKIKSVEVTGTRSVRRHKTKKEFIELLDGHKIASVQRRGKYLDRAARRRRGARRAPRHVGAAVAGEDAHARRRRSTRTS